MTNNDIRKKELENILQKCREDKIKLYCIFTLSDDNILSVLNHSTEEAVNKDFHLIYFALKDHVRGLEEVIINSIKGESIKANELAH